MNSTTVTQKLQQNFPSPQKRSSVTAFQEVTEADLSSLSLDFSGDFSNGDGGGLRLGSKTIPWEVVRLLCFDVAGLFVSLAALWYLYGGGGESEKSPGVEGNSTLSNISFEDVAGRSQHGHEVIARTSIGILLR